MAKPKLYATIEIQCGNLTVLTSERWIGPSPLDRVVVAVNRQMRIHEMGPLTRLEISISEEATAEDVRKAFADAIESIPQSNLEESV